MREYHKIVTVFERNPETKFKTLLEGKWAKPEFEILKDIHWIGTEKIDGTNIRIVWDGESVVFKGRTDNAQLYAPLVEVMQSKFYSGAMAEIFDFPVCLYGEGFGAKIQKVGGNYIPGGNDFILFDVKVGDNWLQREDVADIANKLQIDVVPIVYQGDLLGAIDTCRTGFNSTFGSFRAEGLVMRPAIELKDRVGHRIITKIKCKDFQ